MASQVEIEVILHSFSKEELKLVKIGQRSQDKLDKFIWRNLQTA